MFNLKPLIYRYDNKKENDMYIMREDLLPFSFGGNKVRKNLFYFDEILLNNYNHVVTYGSKSSNHARIVANLCSKYKIKCTIITPHDSNSITYNTKINQNLRANIVITSLDRVEKTIEKTLSSLRDKGEKVYFIEGGGHGFLGTKAYVEAFYYIEKFSKETNVYFDHIFLASGTGATQAGLEIGNYLNNYNSEIYGISVARSKKRGEEVIEASIKEYSHKRNYNISKLNINFNDSFIFKGYGEYSSEITTIIKKYLIEYGIPLDPVYTGKAAYGMHHLIKEKDIKDKNILFIHTGGGPLFFDFLKENRNEEYYF